MFRNVTMGMTFIMTDPSRVRRQDARNIEIEAEDRESLLVEWLNEIIYLTEVEGMIFADFEIGEIAGTRLSATAIGEAIDPSRHELKTEIKACTYHELKLEKENSDWVAQVIFDV